MENKLREKFNTLRTYIVDIRDGRFDDNSLDYMEQQLEELETLINEQRKEARVEAFEEMYAKLIGRNDTQVYKKFVEQEVQSFIKEQRNLLKTNTDKEDKNGI